MKKQTPEKEQEQGVTAEVQAEIAGVTATADALSREMRTRQRDSILRQYRCAALTGILSGMNFTGAMEDMVVIARKIGLLMLEADEKEAAKDENLR